MFLWGLRGKACIYNSVSGKKVDALLKLMVHKQSEIWTGITSLQTGQPQVEARSLG